MPASAPPLRLTSGERRAAAGLAAIYAMRMLGLFLILPVFALYAQDLEGVTPVLVGLAVGIYGLTQALLQIPFGLLSDRIGRKPVIVAGLLLFALGSLVAALSDSIHGVILGRALQGAGAVSAAVMALAADLSREEIRTRLMALLGVSVGLAFVLSLVLGPVLQHWIGVPGMFWLIAALALGGVLVILFLVPHPPRPSVHRDSEPVPAQFRGVLANRELLRLDYGMFSMHFMGTALFLGLPLELHALGLPTQDHWQVYLPVLVASMAGMVPFILVAERRGRMKAVVLGAILTLGLGQVGLYLLGTSLAGLVTALFVYFLAFNLLEATLPALVAKLAPPAAKGTAMGLFTTSQFLGAFLGGLLGGWAQHLVGVSGVFLLSAGVALSWLLLALPMANPRTLSSQSVRLASPPLNDAQARSLVQRLRAVAGVAEAVVVAEEGMAHLKVDPARLDRAALGRVIAAKSW